MKPKLGIVVSRHNYRLKWYESKLRPCAQGHKAAEVRITTKDANQCPGGVRLAWQPDAINTVAVDPCEVGWYALVAKE